jgi:hypothetical protein
VQRGGEQQWPRHPPLVKRAPHTPNKKHRWCPPARSRASLIQGGPAATERCQLSMP